MDKRSIAQIVRQKIAADAAPHANAIPADGEVWWCAPPDHPWLLIEHVGGRQAAPRTVGDDLQPVSLVEGKCWVTVTIRTDAAGGHVYLKHTLRPGLVLRTVALGGEVLLFPGTTSSGRASADYPALHLVDPRGVARSGVFEPWNVSLSTETPGDGLVEPHPDSNAYRVGVTLGAPGDAGRQLLRTVLGLSPQTWLNDPAYVAKTRAAAVRRRGEIVRVNTRVVRHRAGPRFGLVVSDDLLNGLESAWCVVAPLVTREPGDSLSDGFVPLADRYVEQCCGRMSVDTFGIRGHTRAGRTTIPLNHRLNVQQLNPGLWADVERGLLGAVS